MADGRALWASADEIRYLRGLAISKPSACVAYCRYILADGRRWDGTVDVAAVKAEAARLIGPLSGLMTRAAGA